MIVSVQVKLGGRNKCQRLLKTPDFFASVFSALDTQGEDLCACGQDEICDERQMCPNVTPSAEPSYTKSNLIDWLVLQHFSPPSPSPSGYPSDGSHELSPNQRPFTSNESMVND